VSKLAVLRWFLVVGIVFLVAVAPIVFYRNVYVENRRLREVSPGRFYRSGPMTQGGFADAVRLYGIRTIINLRDEAPDPDIGKSFWCSDTIKESQLCKQLGVRYVFLPPGLIPRRQVPERRSESVDRLLELFDDPATYPVLIHCKAGLHRTGVVVAAYRMEYEGWTPQQALQELRDNGFGLWVSTSSNEYIRQYILKYRPGIRYHRGE
jgi:protein tyrosine phosphatase (PTP) superfamily phosphohydrolase (DUF442 family)